MIHGLARKVRVSARRLLALAREKLMMHEEKHALPRRVGISARRVLALTREKPMMHEGEAHPPEEARHLRSEGARPPEGEAHDA